MLPDRFFVKDQISKKILLNGHLEGGLYKLSVQCSLPTSCHQLAALLSTLQNASLWHQRLGHSSFQLFVEFFLFVVLNLALLQSNFVIPVNWLKFIDFPFSLQCLELANLLNLSISNGFVLENASIYRTLVGALQYCTMTRPDISFTVNSLCQFFLAPSTLHMQAFKRLLRYLKGTDNLGILFTPSPASSVTCYTDADWASSPYDRRSTSGFCVFLGSNLIS